MTKNETLIAAGIIAAQKWDIDPTRVNIKIVDSLEPFKVKLVSEQKITPGPIEIAVPIPPSDDIIFKNYDGVQWRLNGFEFWLAWGPITKTLAIHIRSMAQKCIGEMVRYDNF